MGKSKIIFITKSGKKTAKAKQIVNKMLWYMFFPLYCGFM